MRLALRRNSGCKIINRIVRQLPREDLVLVRLARRHNLRQRGDCSVRPKPQHSLLNLGLVVAPVLLGRPVLPLEQRLVRLVSNNSSSSSSNHSNSLRGLRSVRLVKLSHNNRLASALVVSAPRNHSNKPAVSSVPLLSIKSPPPLDSVRVSRFNLVLSTDASKALQPRAQALSLPVPELLVRLSHRPLPLALHLNNHRVVRSVLEYLAPVSPIGSTCVLI